MSNTSVSQPELSVSRPTADTLLVSLAGSWKLANRLPSTVEVQNAIESGPRIKQVTFETERLTDWDSGLLTFLIKLVQQASKNEIQLDRQGLPAGARRLLDLALAVPEKRGTHKEAGRGPVLERIGERTIAVSGSAIAVLSFLGEAVLAFVKLIRGKARFRRADLALIIQEVGAQALPIVTLISFLVGVILAFVGSVQLRKFGAQIFVADLVGLAMVREMGAMMTGIIMAGRTGAAFAAQLGTMTVNEEIDALSTMGISPMEFLVMPRMLALMLMMPLLCLYADLMGMVGGLVVGVGVLDLAAQQYFSETRAAVEIIDVVAGLIKGAVYGVLVAIAGCLRGMQSGRSAAAVGEATTSAVVTGIVLIVVASAILTATYDVLGV